MAAMRAAATSSARAAAVVALREDWLADERQGESQSGYRISELHGPSSLRRAPGSPVRTTVISAYRRGTGQGKKCHASGAIRTM